MLNKDLFKYIHICFLLFSTMRLNLPLTTNNDSIIDDIQIITTFIAPIKHVMNSSNMERFIEAQELMYHPMALDMYI